MENDTCGADAIQADFGLHSFGKGNLYFKDYGKMVYTVFQPPEWTSHSHSLKTLMLWSIRLWNATGELKGQDFLDPQEEMELGDALARCSN